MNFIVKEALALALAVGLGGAEVSSKWFSEMENVYLGA